MSWSRFYFRPLVMGFIWLVMADWLCAQQPPYDVYPEAKPPYYRVRYEASEAQGKLSFPVNYTIWIPSEVKELKGVIVHQHGCGEGSCKSGLTGAFDLHWQALAKKHRCALLAPAYEQPEKADCQLWCDPRNGSAESFLQALSDLGRQSGHPELASVPWALWGHSGGGHWCGGMVMLYPERVAAAWLRSGVPLFKENPQRNNIRAHVLPEAALKVPMMCNLGTKEGVTDKEGRFAGVWPANEEFFNFVRSRGGLVTVSVDPLTSHECGNQRYFAIPWLDACLESRLSIDGKPTLRTISEEGAWYSEPLGVQAESSVSYKGDRLKASWHLNESMAKMWEQYVRDTEVVDKTPPPKVNRVTVEENRIQWEAEGDLESGLAKFIIIRDGTEIATLPDGNKNPFGRAVFQGLQYSDTPNLPLVRMEYIDQAFKPGAKHNYRVISVNTVGLKSE